MIRKLVKRLLKRLAPPEVVVLLKHLHPGTKGVFAPRSVEVTATVPGVPVLILAPHPDDEAIGMGGVLSQHITAGSRISVLYLTDGRGHDSHNLTARRREEAKLLGLKYGIHQIFWDIEDGSLRNDAPTVSEMERVLIEAAPARVYLPSFFERQYDHFATNGVLLDALKSVKVDRCEVFGYEVWDNIPFPNYVVNITSNFEMKKEILSHYTIALNETDFIELARHRNALHHSLYVENRRGREGYAEGFCCLDYRFYREAYEEYRQVLQECRSSLMSRSVSA